MVLHIPSGSTFEAEIGYSRALVDGNMIYVSGTTGYDYATMTLPSDPAVQAANALATIAHVLDEVGSSLKDVVRVRYYLANRADLDASMIQTGEVADLVVERAARAFEAGADGIIASPNEAARIRALPEAEGRLIVTPGVRPAGSADDDQKRIATPANAVAAGADHIVVGRPVWRSESPRDAALSIQRELASPQAQRPNRG